MATTPAPDAHPGRWRWPLRILAIVLGLVLLLVILVVGAVLILVKPENYQQLLIDQVRERTGRELVLGAPLAAQAQCPSGQVQVCLGGSCLCVPDPVRLREDSLNLAAAGLTADGRGRLRVNDDYQTEVPHIYAAGDVIGFPSLASTSMEQGRLAACHALGVATNSVPGLFPYGIYTIPEISMVGHTEEELTELELIEYCRPALDRKQSR